MPDPEAKVEPEIKTGETPPEVKGEASPEVKLETPPEVKAEGETKVEPKLEPPPPKPAKDWRDSRIAELTAKLNQAKAKTLEPPKAEGETEAAFDARVEARARVLADEAGKINTWNARCNAVVVAGKAAHPDFDSRLGELKALVNGQDEGEVAQYNEVLAAALETGKAHEVLYDLSSDPGEFRRLMGLPPMKKAMEVATRAAGLGATPEPSKMPAPIRPIDSKGLHYEGIKPDDPNRGTKLPIKEWMAQREAQVRERGLQ